jgi:hypothetical protein
MEGHVVITIFEWKGRWRWYADRVMPAPRSRVARRTRLRSDTSQGEGFRSPQEALREAATYLRSVAADLELGITP